jgi:hypothetical protein
MTLEPTATVASTRSGRGREAGPVPVPYISFSATVGRNSNFEDLSSEQLEELGGVEYRALGLLAWLVPLVRLSSVLSAGQSLPRSYS